MTNEEITKATYRACDVASTELQDLNDDLGPSAVRTRVQAIEAAYLAQLGNSGIITKEMGFAVLSTLNLIWRELLKGKVQ